ncbi:MAG: thioredoxin domain-containing protein [Deltaproteobacteria bacterium]|nr:thioredoxin domain-containing protein [Deltaproteobacteria bacterium]
MKVKLFAAVAATLLFGACQKGAETPPAAEQVKPAEGEKAAADKAAEAKPAEAATGKVDYPHRGAPADTAKVHIIEFSDFQCPFCGRVNPTIKQIEETYPDTVRVTFLHNPLPFHKDAQPAALAAAAAGKQGKFFEMHDKLFENQRALKPEDLEKYATEIGLDVEQFKKDIADPEVAKFVENNRLISNAVGATGTPAFFINGQSLKGAQPFEKFKEVIDAEIAAADAANKKGADWLKERLKANNADLASYYYEGKTPPAVQQAKPEARPVDRTVYKVTVDPAKDAIKGKNDAPVTLVVFSEFQCPFCKRVEPALQQVAETYGDKVRFVFKHNPLPFHKDAFPASEAAMCAKEQGKFWEMHDKLFENQRDLSADALAKYAGEVGVDAGKWKKCMDSHKYKNDIEESIELAGKVTARGTPNTFVNGRKLTGAKPFEEFKTVIDEEIAKAEALVKDKGIAADKVYEEIIKDGKVFEPLEEQVFKLELNDKANMKGSKGAKVQIVEFSDFQCPFCSRVTAPLEEVKKHYGDDAVVVFKNFPLSFHKEAMPAAIAAECAAEQGKFWEMHDKLFANQKDLGTDNYFAWAKEIGLNDAKFKDCFDNQKPKAKIEADMAEARTAQVRGTPSVYINGRKFTSPSGYNLDAFTSVIDKYILGKK